MAEGKKSFILYCDLVNITDQLNDKEAGQLFKMIVDYVNDRDPEPPNRLLGLTFEPIKRQLKRDLKVWQKNLEKKSEAGLKSAGVKAFKKELEECEQMDGFKEMSLSDLKYERARCIKYMNESHGTHDHYKYKAWVEWYNQQILTKSTGVESVATKSTVNVTDTVTVNDNVTDNDTENVTVNYSREEKNLPKSNEPKGSIVLSQELLDGIKDFYNENRGDMPRIVTMSNSRKNLIRLRLKEFGKSGVAQAILEAGANPFWQGEGKDGWLGNFDTIFKPDKMAKLIEGAYRHKEPKREMSTMERINREVGNL